MKMAKGRKTLQLLEIPRVQSNLHHDHIGDLFYVRLDVRCDFRFVFQINFPPPPPIVPPMGTSGTPIGTIAQQSEHSVHGGP